MKKIFQTLPEVVGNLLKKRKSTLAVAESCTGGWISNLLTNISGATKYFECGMVVYSNRSKIKLLGVHEETLKKFGAVSREVAKEMAEGVRKSAATTYGLAVTGIAGPTGGTREKPVGTVYVALSTHKKTEVKRFHFPEGRLSFKILTAAKALEMLRAELLKK